MSKVHETADLYVLTLKGLEWLVIEQLPTINPKNIIVVPERRNTLPHTAYALCKLSIPPDEPVMFVPVDHYFLRTDLFIDSMKQVSDRIPAKLHDTYLLCTPTKKVDPSLGYVILDSDENVSKFVEKPDKDDTDMLLQSIFNINTMRYITSKIAFIHLLVNTNNDVARQAQAVVDSSPNHLDNSFLAMPFIDICYGLFEKSKGLKAISIQGDFIDIGKFSTLFELNHRDAKGNAVIGTAILDEDSTNNFIINQLEYPLVVVNTQNSVVVQTHLGSFVSPITDADKIGEIYKTKIHTS